jgi:hypothetical protein
MTGKLYLGFKLFTLSRMTLIEAETPQKESEEDKSSTQDQILTNPSLDHRSYTFYRNVMSQYSDIDLEYV